MDQIVIVGSAGHAKVVIDIVRQQGLFGIAGLLDRFRQVRETTEGLPVLGGEEDLPRLVAEKQIRGVIVAIGDNHIRAGVAAHVRELCPVLPFVSAIHPRAVIAPSATIGAGSVVMAGATINPQARVGEHCIVNTQASLDHDTTLGDLASLAPGVLVGGGCEIGAQSAICIGAVLIHGVQVGARSVIGAGSLVTRSIPSNVVAYGRPAVVIRARQASDRYL